MQTHRLLIERNIKVAAYRVPQKHPHEIERRHLSAATDGSAVGRASDGRVARAAAHCAHTLHNTAAAAAAASASTATVAATDGHCAGGVATARVRASRRTGQ